MDNFTLIVILKYKNGESYLDFYIYIIFLNSMESKNKFKPDPNLKLMDQVR